MAALAFSISCLAQPPKELWKTSGANGVEVAVLLPNSAFTEPAVIGLCRAFLKSHRETAIRYVIATDEQDAIQRLSGRVGTEWGHKVWLSAYLQTPDPLPAAAEMIRVGPNSSVRIYFPGGKRSEHVLEGSSVFPISSGSFRGTLMGLKLTGLSTAPGYGPHLFVQMEKAWPQEAADRLSSRLRQLLGNPYLIVSLEDGWWFAWDEEYVVRNRFLPFKKPPTLEEDRAITRYYSARPSVACSKLRGPKQ